MRLIPFIILRLPSFRLHVWLSVVRPLVRRPLVPLTAAICFSTSCRNNPLSDIHSVLSKLLNWCAPIPKSSARYCYQKHCQPLSIMLRCLSLTWFQYSAMAGAIGGVGLAILLSATIPTFGDIILSNDQLHSLSLWSRYPNDWWSIHPKDESRK